MTEPARILGICVPAQPDQLSVIRRATRAAAQTAGMTGDCVEETILAVDEACQNVIRHAYGETGTGDIELDFTSENGAFVVRIRDYAPPVDPARIRPRDLDDLRPGGLGTRFIAEVMDKVEYLPGPQGRGNLLQLTRRLRRET